MSSRYYVTDASTPMNRGGGVLGGPAGPLTARAMIGRTRKPMDAERYQREVVEASRLGKSPAPVPDRRGTSNPLAVKIQRASEKVRAEWER